MTGHGGQENANQCPSIEDHVSSFLTRLKEGTEVAGVLKAPALREIYWIQSHAKPHKIDDLVLSSEAQEDPLAHINLLQRYLNIVPLLAENVAFKQPVPRHMDLHLASIFIESEKRPVITAIIDWQGLSVLPLSLVATFSRIIDYDIGEDPVTVDMPPEVETVDPAAKEDREAIMLKKYWLAKTWNVNAKLAAALQEPPHNLLRSLWIESGRTWTGELASFRHDLIEFVDRSEDCPVSFSQEERAIHKQELEEYRHKVMFLNHFREVLGVSSEGWVSLDRYDVVMVANQESKRSFAIKQSNGDEKLREAWEQLWPFSDK